MGKVIRLSDQTERLLEIYKKHIKADFKSIGCEESFKGLNDDIHIQTALMWAIEGNLNK